MASKNKLEWHTENRYCLYCGMRLPAVRGRNRRYCATKCRMAAHYLKIHRVVTKVGFTPY